MARKKTASAEVTTEAPATDRPDVFDEAITAQKDAVVQQVADSTHLPPDVQPAANGSHAHHHAPHRQNGQSHAEAVGKRLPNPFDFETHRAGKNRVVLLKSETDQQRREGRGAWVIRFAYNPNNDPGPEGEAYGKGNPHPVLKMLKDEGYRWDFDAADGKGGWGKPFSADRYGQDHLEARKMLQKAAEMIGAGKEQGIPL